VPVSYTDAEGVDSVEVMAETLFDAVAQAVAEFKERQDGSDCTGAGDGVQGSGATEARRTSDQTEARRRVGAVRKHDGPRGDVASGARTADAFDKGMMLCPSA
jgi:hypothetical protein